MEHAKETLGLAHNFQKELAEAIISGVQSNLDQIDQLIEKSATEWPLSQVAKIDLVILRIAIFELKFSESDAPKKVVIDEAVELAKEFGSETSSSFVNGVLGNIVSGSNREQSDGQAAKAKH